MFCIVCFNCLQPFDDFQMEVSKCLKHTVEKPNLESDDDTCKKHITTVIDSVKVSNG